MTITLAREARRNAALFSGAEFTAPFQPRLSFAKRKQDNGVEVQVLQVADMPVFRSGTFRDSMGFQHTWESLHMDQMVMHFDLLKNRQILADIPVRKGHGSFLGEPMDGLIGWHTALRTKQIQNPADGTEYTYLVADYDILDSDAIQKISNGLWRNRSAEVGSYVNNAEAEFWPVYMGVAYVDFSAVEGLNVYSANPLVGSQFSLMYENDKEVPSVGTQTSTALGAVTTGTPQPVVTPAAPVVPVATQVPPAVVPVTPVETAPVVNSDVEEDEDKNGQSAHGRPANSSSFSINGQVTTDYAAVQRHIQTLESFAKETLESGRKQFVHGLAAGPSPKISAPQVEQLEAFALTLNEDQWKSWTASWTAAPASPLLGLHAGSGNTSTTQHTAASAAADEIAIQEGIVRQHTLSGMRPEVLQQTASFKRLQELRAAQSTQS